MKLVFRYSLAFVALVAISASVPAQGPARQGRTAPGNHPLMRKMFEAAGTATYSGRRVIEFKRGVERMRHEELVLKSGPRMRIEFPRGSAFEGQVIVETGAERRHYYPGRNEIHVLPARKDEALERLRGLIARLGPQGLSVALEGQAKVAKQDTSILSLRDGRGNRLMRLWIQPSTGVVLKRELYDEVGAVVGLFEFTEYNPSPLIRRTDFVLQREGATIVTPMDIAQRLIREHKFEPAFLPAEGGFRLDTAQLVENLPVPVLLLLYQSPHGPISFYQVAGKVNPERLARLSGAGFKSFAWTKGTRSFVLVGSLEARQLQQLAARVQNP